MPSPIAGSVNVSQFDSLGLSNQLGVLALRFGQRFLRWPRLALSCGAKPGRVSPSPAANKSLLGEHLQHIANLQRLTVFRRGVRNTIYD